MDAEKMLLPEKVLLLARSVDDAAVIVTPLPILKVVPLMVPREPAMKLVLIEEVAMIRPLLSVARIREAVMLGSQVEPRSVVLVEDAPPVKVVRPVKVEDAWEMRPFVNPMVVDVETP